MQNLECYHCPHRERAALDVAGAVAIVEADDPGIGSAELRAGPVAAGIKGCKPALCDVLGKDSVSHRFLELVVCAPPIKACQLTEAR